MKLNKSILPVLNAEMDSKYIAIDQLLVINSKFQDIWRNVRQREALVDEEIERHKSHIDDVVNKSIAENLETRFKHYESVSKQFSQFFDQAELGSLIDRKADLELISRIQEQKADKGEMGTVAQDLEEAVEDFDLKLKHMAVFISELSKTLLPNKKSGKFKN